MTVDITSGKLIKDIQQDFNQSFPFLKIEFFRTCHASLQADHKGFHVNGQFRLKTASSNVVGTDNKVKITGSITVNELDKNCRQAYGVYAQVYRKSGNLWLETSMTNHWTIDQQNRMGMEISTLIARSELSRYS